jgi:Bacterial type II and III secretion system protein
MDAIMKRGPALPFILALCSLAAWTVQAQVPQRELRVELRQIEEGGAGYVVSTQPAVALLAPQQVQVRNGRKAVFSMSQAIPLQWVQAVSTQNSSLTVPGAQARSSGAGVRQGLTWMQAGQQISVLPRWPGGQREVSIEVEVQTDSVQSRAGSDLPVQSRSQLATTVGAPLGQWVTIATTGSSPQRGVYSSEAAVEARRLLQLRVSAR